ncbi:MAG: hypothetical protein EA362_05125 [Saprospirales bacterium]|nr:MAG: hypothetical protein EA362_05125 [Saprospirales bacterium]
MAVKDKKLHLALIFATLGIVLSSCVDDGPRPLNEAQRELKDSLILKGMRETATQQDSICEMEMDSLVNIFYDSLLRERLLEIEKLRGGR